MKFYMNNPCKVIREIGSDFVEIQVWPKVAEDYDGTQWCEGCQLGTGDPYWCSHTCDEYQAVIDAINEDNQSMIVVAEKRLLQNEPVEAGKWRSVIERMKEQDKLYKERNKEMIDMQGKHTVYEQDIIDFEEKLSLLGEKEQAMQADISVSEKKLDALRKSIISVSASSGSIDISPERLLELLTKEIKLDALQSDGVDNLEWYGESFPEDIEGDAFNELQKHLK